MGLPFVSGKVKAAGKVSTLSTFVLGLTVYLVDKYDLLHGLPTAYAGFVEAGAASVIVGGVTFLAGYASKHAPGVVAEVKRAYSDVSAHDQGVVVDPTKPETPVLP